MNICLKRINCLLKKNKTHLASGKRRTGLKVPVCKYKQHWLKIVHAYGICLILEARRFAVYRL